jgi:hypothetical protein
MSFLGYWMPIVRCKSQGTPMARLTTLAAVAVKSNFSPFDLIFIFQRLARTRQG